MDEQSKLKCNDWVRCQSKSHSNRYYLFNTKTGEARWSTDSSDIKTQPTILAKHIMKTPAQDRLKRLQRNLQKTKPKESALVKAKDGRQCKKLNFSSEKEKQNASKESLAVDKPSPTNKEVSSTSRSENTGGKPSVSKKITDTSNPPIKLVKDSTTIEKQPYSIPTEKSKFRIPKKLTSQTEITSAKKAAKQNASEYVASTSCSSVQTKKRANQSSFAPSDLKKDSTEACSPKRIRTSIEIKTNPIMMSAGIEREKMIHCDINDKVKSSINDGEKSGVISVIKDFCTSLFKKVGHTYKVKPPEDATKQSNLSHNSKPSFKSKQLECNKFVLKGALQENQSRRSEARISYSASTTSPSPSIAGSANDRLLRLRKSLQVQQACLKPTQHTLALSPASPETSTNSISCSPSVSVLESEPMDWQPIFEESFKDVTNTSLLGSNINSTNVSTRSEHYETVNENLLRLAAEKKQEKQWKTNYFYFVVDTNVFLENVTFVDELTTMKLCDTAGTLIYVPYSVLQELDKLKIRSPSESIKTRSTRAIKYLNNAFENKAQHIQAQSAADEHNHLIKVKSPDDSILNCCLQVKKHIDNVLLLTEDINLRNKAMSSNILVSTKSDLISKHESKI